MVPLGSSLPAFSAKDALSGKDFSSETLSGKPVLIAFICCHCPFVVHVEDDFAELCKTMQERGVQVVAIQSNDVENYPDDRPEKMSVQAKKLDFDFPYLHDETQSIAKSMDAACTPDFFLYDTDHNLFYRGQMDGSRPGNEVPVTGVDLISALDFLLAGAEPPAEQKPSIGCNIKWK
jgi:peroxiredoxin